MFGNTDFSYILRAEQNQQRPFLLNNAVVKIIMRLAPRKDTCYTNKKKQDTECMTTHTRITHACGQRVGIS